MDWASCVPCRRYRKRWAAATLPLPEKMLAWETGDEPPVEHDGFIFR
jgi:hypothetical protein